MGKKQKLRAGIPTPNASDAFKDAEFEIEIRVRKDWRFRLGLLLLWLAAKVLRSDFKEKESALLKAARAAYWHLDIYGTVQGGSDCEMENRKKVLDLLRPYV